MNHSDSVKERILWLRHQIIEHNKHYYLEDAPVIADKAFDSLVKELNDVFNAHPEFAELVNEKDLLGVDLSGIVKSKKHRHMTQMYSLQNAFNNDDILLSPSLEFIVFVSVFKIVSKSLMTEIVVVFILSIPKPLNIGFIVS